MSVAFQSRKRWHNNTGNQSVEPLRIYRPATLAELRKIVRTAEADKTTVRAVGSGHSWSDVALTTGYLVRTDRLARELEVDCLRRDWDGAPLARVEAGMRIRALNQLLAGRGLALSQMGGYDAQTVAGVVSTATHGSGISLGPICDYVQTLDLVAAGGRVHRIERAGGPTDATAFARTHADWELRQDDHVFDAALVNMGCMGVVYAATIAVEQAYWLTEVRELSTWSQVRGQLAAELERNRHYEVYLNLYPRDGGEHRCIVCRRNRTADPGHRRATDRLHRHWWLELASRSKVIPFVGNIVLDLSPASAPRRTDQMLAVLADNEYSGPSYKVLNIGAANFLPAYSSEPAVPVERHAEAVDALIDVAARHRDLGSIYHTGLVSLRFVRASPAYLAMMHDRDTMMIELIQATHTEGGYELLGACEDALDQLGARPHWGQVNTLTGGRETLRRLYPAFDRWLEVHDELNASRVFDSPFARRVGISAR